MRTCSICLPLSMLYVLFLFYHLCLAADDDPDSNIWCFQQEKNPGCPEGCYCNVRYSLPMDMLASMVMNLKVEILCQGTSQTESYTTDKFEQELTEYLRRVNGNSTSGSGAVSPGAITELYISYSPLSRVIPGICNLTELVILDLSNNHITGDTLVGNCLYSLIHLKRVSFSGNRLGTLRTGTFHLREACSWEMRERRNISLDQAGVTGIEPWAVRVDPWAGWEVGLEGNPLGGIDRWLVELTRNTSRWDCRDITGGGGSVNDCNFYQRGTEEFCRTNIYRTSFRFTGLDINKTSDVLGLSSQSYNWTAPSPILLDVSGWGAIEPRKWEPEEISAFYRGLGFNTSELNAVVSLVRVPHTYPVVYPTLHVIFQQQYPDVGFQCDCHLYPLFPFLRVASTIFCSEPDAVIPIYNMDPSRLVCPLVEKCPDDCACRQRPASRSISLTCKYSYNTTQLPQSLDLPPPKHLQDDTNQPYTYHIDASLGFLRLLDKTDYMLVLANLNVSRNRIVSVSWKVVDMFLETNGTLDLTGNDLQRLGHQGESVPDYMITDNHTGTLLLYNNPWKCDCDFKPTWKWLITHKEQLFLPREDGIKCLGGRYDGVSVLQLEGDRLCEIVSKEVQHALALSISLVVVSVILLVVGYKLSYCYRVRLYTAFRLRLYDKDECEGEDMRYDVFFSYAKEDGLFARRTCTELEAEGYKVCLYERDFLLGGDILELIQTAIVSSKRTVCFLSPRFLGSSYCMFEFRNALATDEERRRNRLKVVMLEDIDVTADTSIQTYIKMYNYIKWDAPNFMEQLRYALAENKLGTTQQTDDCTRSGETTGENRESEPLLNPGVNVVEA